MCNIKAKSFSHSAEGHTASKERVIGASWSDHHLHIVLASHPSNVICLCLNIHISENIFFTLSMKYKSSVLSLCCVQVVCGRGVFRFLLPVDPVSK